jgi:hypothetical protein
MPVATAPSEIDEIRRQMALIRHELHVDVQGVVETAEAVADWRHYIRRYPWVALGAAAVVGYLIVPRRQPAAPRAVAGQPEVAQSVASVKAEDKQENRASLIGMAFGMLAPVAVRFAQGYAVKYLEHWIAQQHLRQGPPSSMPASGTGAGPGRSPGH